MGVYHQIVRAGEKGLTREELSAKTGFDERCVEAILMELQDNRMVVCSPEARYTCDKRRAIMVYLKGIPMPVLDSPPGNVRWFDEGSGDRPYPKRDTDLSG